MDFIDEQPLESYPGGAHALAQALGEMISRMQATSRFPRFVEYPDIVARLWAHVCRTGLFASDVLDTIPSISPASARLMSGNPRNSFPATTTRSHEISCSTASGCG
jgi:hypothetical protein